MKQCNQGIALRLACENTEVINSNMPPDCVTHTNNFSDASQIHTHKLLSFVLCGIVTFIVVLPGMCVWVLRNGWNENRKLKNFLMRLCEREKDFFLVFRRPNNKIYIKFVINILIVDNGNKL